MCGHKGYCITTCLNNLYTFKLSFSMLLCCVGHTCIRKSGPNEESIYMFPFNHFPSLLFLSHSHLSHKLLAILIAFYRNQTERYTLYIDRTCRACAETVVSYSTFDHRSKHTSHLLPTCFQTKLTTLDTR